MSAPVVSCLKDIPFRSTYATLSRVVNWTVFSSLSGFLLKTITFMVQMIRLHSSYDIMHSVFRIGALTIIGLFLSIMCS